MHYQTYEKAKKDVARLLSNEVGAAYIKGLRKGAKVELFAPDGSPLGGRQQ